MIAQSTGTDHRHWDYILPKSRSLSIIKIPPAEIVFGRNLKDPTTQLLIPPSSSNTGEKKERAKSWEETTENKRASEKQKHSYNLRRRRNVIPAIGSLERSLSSAVNRFAQKLEKKYSGPHTITNHLYSNILEVIDAKGKTFRIHVNDTKHFMSRGGNRKK